MKPASPINYRLARVTPLLAFYGLPKYVVSAGVSASPFGDFNVGHPWPGTNSVFKMYLYALTNRSNKSVMEHPILFNSSRVMKISIAWKRIANWSEHSPFPSLFVSNGSPRKELWIKLQVISYAFVSIVQVLYSQQIYSKEAQMPYEYVPRFGKYLLMRPILVLLWCTMEWRFLAVNRCLLILQHYFQEISEIPSSKIMISIRIDFPWLSNSLSIDASIINVFNYN